MNRDTSEPSFPIFPDIGGGHASAYRGLSMRDYFAAKAVQGILCDGAAWVGESAITQAASVCYKLADAMLEARK